MYHQLHGTGRRLQQVSPSFLSFFGMAAPQYVDEVWSRAFAAGELDVHTRSFRLHQEVPWRQANKVAVSSGRWSFCFKSRMYTCVSSRAGLSVLRTEQDLASGLMSLVGNLLSGYGVLRAAGALHQRARGRLTLHACKQHVHPHSKHTEYSTALASELSEICMPELGEFAVEHTPTEYVKVHQGVGLCKQRCTGSQSSPAGLSSAMLERANNI